MITFCSRGDFFTAPSQSSLAVRFISEVRIQLGLRAVYVLPDPPVWRIKEMLLFLLLPFLHAAASTSTSTSSKVVGKDDHSYIEAYKKEHGTDYNEESQEDEDYEYQYESEVRSGGLDAEVRCEKFSISLSSRSATVANRTSKLEMMQ